MRQQLDARVVELNKLCHMYVQGAQIDWYNLYSGEGRKKSKHSGIRF